MSKMKLVLDVVQDLRHLADSIEALCDGIETGPASEESSFQPTEQVAATPAIKQPSLVELRAFVASKNNLQTKPLIQALLKQHGVKKLTELPEDQYAQFMEEVAGL